MIEQAQKHILAGEFEKAEALYRSMLNDTPDKPELLYLLSVALKRQDKRGEELKYLHQAYDLAPIERFVLHGLGNAYLHQGDFEKALEYFDKEVRVNPNYPQGHAASAYTHLRQGNWQQAEQFARTALRAKEEHPPTMLILASALLEQGQADKAVNYYQRIVELDPENDVALEGLARAFLLNGQAAFAAQCCHNALKIDPDQGGVLELLGKAEQAQSRWKFAAEAYAMALELAPENLACLAGLAQVLSELSQDQQAEHLYMRLLRLDPYRNAERLQLGRIFIKQGKYRKVAGNLSPLFSLPNTHPDRLSAYVIMAQLFLLEGEAEKAMEALQPVLLGESVEPQAQILHAEILVYQNQPEAALSQLAQLVASDDVPSHARLLATELWLGVGGVTELGLALAQVELLEQQGQMNTTQTLEVKLLRIRILHGLGQYAEAINTAAEIKREMATIASLSEDLEDSDFEIPSTDEFFKFLEESITDGRPEPIFLLAWPGTGRQKLLAALQAHPELTVVNDADKLQQERLELLLGHVDGPALEDMTETDIRLLRRRYQRELKKSLPDWVEISRVVDALWLPVEALPMLYRLFPLANIVFLEREISDLELSWKLHGYQDIETMKSQWNRQSQLCLQAKDLIPARISSLEWNQLDRDTEVELKRLFKELDLSWDNASLSAFARTQVPMVFPAGDWKHYQEVQT